MPTDPPGVDTFRVLVCGGRNYADHTRVYQVLDQIAESRSVTEIIEGDAKGADALARQWAFDRKVAVRTYAANWARYGRTAGPHRNQQMLDEGKPDLVVAFPGGKGTRGMIRLARKARVSVQEVTE